MRSIRRQPEARKYRGAAHRHAIGLFMAVLILAWPAAAEFYRYTDADGQVHYVDDPSQIPDAQMESLRVYQEEDQGYAAPDGQGREEAAAAAVDGDLDDLAPSTPSVMESPVIVRGNRVLVPVTISYLGRKVEANLLFDTGASFTILHQKIARKIMLSGTENREAVVVGGSRIPIRMAQVDYIQIGPYKVPNAQLAIIRNQGPDQGHQGLLGMNILRMLDYTLDVDRGVIVWNR